MVIGLPPVLNFGSEELKAKVVPDVFAGKKFISLAISEAFAGSDVAGLQYVVCIFRPTFRIHRSSVDARPSSRKMGRTGLSMEQRSQLVRLMDPN